MTMPNKNRHRVTNLQLSEISSVDRPAQEGALAVLMKRYGAGNDVAICKNAQDVADGGQPAFAVHDFEDAMLNRAAEIGKERGCTPEQALAKCLSTDPMLRDLAHASEVARAAAYAVGIRKRQGVVAA